MILLFVFQDISTLNLHKNAHIELFFFSCPGENAATFDNKPFKFLNIQLYQDYKPFTHTVLQDFTCGRLSDPYH